MALETHEVLRCPAARLPQINNRVSSHPNSSPCHILHSPPNLSSSYTSFSSFTVRRRRIPLGFTDYRASLATMSEMVIHLPLEYSLHFKYRYQRGGSQQNMSLKSISQVVAQSSSSELLCFMALKLREFRRGPSCLLCLNSFLSSPQLSPYKST